MLVHTYNSSVTNAVTTEFPEHFWELWSFPASKKGWWVELSQNYLLNDPVSIATLRQFVEQLIVRTRQAHPILDHDELLKKVEILLHKNHLYRIAHFGTVSSVFKKLGLRAAASTGTHRESISPTPLLY